MTRDAVARSDGELLTTNAVVLAGRLQVREKVGAGQDLAAAFEPVLRRDPLERGDDRSFDPAHGVAPGAPAAAARVEPPVSDARAAGERDLAVDHQQLAMRPVVDPVQRVPAHRLVGHDPHACGPQPPHRPSPQANAADRVDDDGDVDAVAGALAQRVDERLADAAVLEDVALHVDRALGLSDRLKHGRIERRTVSQDGDAVAVMQRRLAGRLKRVEKTLAVHRGPRRQVIVDRRGEEEDEDQPDEEDPAGDRQPGHRRPAGASACAAAVTVRATLTRPLPVARTNGTASGSSCCRRSRRPRSLGSIVAEATAR